MDDFEPGGKWSRGALSDRWVTAARITAVIATAVGIVLAIFGLLFNLLVLGVIPGLVLIIVGAVAGHIARRARPKPVTITQLVWRIGPTAGCLIGCIYSFAAFGDYLDFDDGGTSLFFLYAVAGIGTIAGILCAFGAWLAHRLLSRAVRNDVATVAAGSVIGGVVGYLLLNSWRQTTPWALVFVVIVTVLLAVAVIIRSARTRAREA